MADDNVYSVGSQPSAAVSNNASSDDNKPVRPKILTAEDLGLNLDDVAPPETIESMHGRQTKYETANNVHAEVEKYDYEDRSLDSIDQSSIKLDDMGGNGQELVAKKALQNQLRLDEMAMSVEKPPVIQDLSDEVKPSHSPRVQVAQPKKSEEQLQKERIARDLSMVPETINRKESLKLYNKLMDEQKVEKVKKGFLVAFLTMVLGVADAVVILLYLFPNFEYKDVYAVAIALFSLLIIVKAKPAKIASAIVFAINTIVMIGPGFILSMIQSNRVQFDQLFFTWIIGIALSIAVTFILATSDTLDVYYEVRFDGKKVVRGDQREYKNR